MKLLQSLPVSNLCPVVVRSTPLAIHLTQGYTLTGKDFIWYDSALPNTVIAGKCARTIWLG